MKSRAYAFSLAIASLILVSTPAAADSWYGAVDAGLATYPDVQGEGGPFGFALGSPSDSTAFRLDAGYRFTPNFSLEGGYVYLGTAADKFDGSDCGLGQCAPFTEDLSIRTSGLVADAVGTWPVSEQVSLFAQAGLIYARSAFSFAVVEPAEGTNVARSSSTNSVRPTFGIGAVWSLTENSGVRLSWMHYQDLQVSPPFFDDETTSSYEVDVWALGFVYSF